jgi:hypothetical protein
MSTKSIAIDKNACQFPTMAGMTKAMITITATIPRSIGIVFIGNILDLRHGGVKFGMEVRKGYIMSPRHVC